MKRVCPPILRDIVPIERDFVLKINNRDIYYSGLWLERSTYSLSEVTPSTSYVTVASHDGSYDVSLTNGRGRAFLGGRTITFSLYTVGDLLQINQSKRYLGSIDGTNVSIDWTPYDGVMSGRLKVGAWSDTWEGSGLTIAKVECTVTCADPFLYARLPETLNFTKKKDSTYMVDAGEFKGNQLFNPVCVFEGVTATYTSMSDGSQILRQSTPSTAATITYDFAARQIRGASGGLLEPDLATDWFEFDPYKSPSDYTFTLTGAQPSSMTLTYTPKWLM